MKTLTIFFVLSITSLLSIQAQTNQKQVTGIDQFASTNTGLESSLAANPNSLATFPGGTKAFNAYLKKEFTYQDIARENGIEGTIIVRCTIDTDGRPSNVTILQAVHPLIDAKALTVVQNMPSWVPAMVNGNPKASVIDIPFQLRLR